MANPEHLAKLMEGVDAWNEWRIRIKVAVYAIFREAGAVCFLLVSDGSS
jgi:hypothetical protein